VLSPQSPSEAQEYQPEHIAAIDLGSNSFHMVVARIDHGEVRILDRLGEKVQLGAGIDAYGNLDLASLNRALDCLKRFYQRIRDLDSSSVQIVGTNALRVAKNRKIFLREAEKVMGFPIEIISGREEARLIYLGVAHTLADDAGNRLVIDIGGGSTELIIGERFETKALESLHMGCVSFRDKYFTNGKLSHSAFDKAITQASRELFNIQHQYKNLGWESCVGSSGSIKAVFQCAAHLGLSEEILNLDVLKQIRKRLVSVENTENLPELGIKKERASIFPAGFSILYACFEVFGIKSMQYTSGALREGLLYDILGRIRHEDVRERSINSMQLRYGVDQQAATYLEKTVVHALGQVAKKWNLMNPDYELLLRWASRIFEVGLTISHTQYHKHGAYLIKHSDLPGFTRLYQLYLSLIVRTHRRKFSPELFSELSDSEKEFLPKLCVLFRLAVVLTAARNSEETDFKLKAKGHNLWLDMGENWLASRPLTLANLESEKDYLKKQGFSLHLS